jgi:hypothetical protein
VITDQGLRLLSAMDRLVKESASIVARGLPSEADQKALISLLARLRGGIDPADR